MGKLIDSIDYKADAFKVAPMDDWRIMEIVGAKVTKKLPRFCPPTCKFYSPDIDKGCKIAFECDHFVFDTHTVKKGEKLFSVLFATSEIDVHTGLLWQVGENYLRGYLGNNVVNRMLKDFHELPMSLLNHLKMVSL